MATKGGPNIVKEGLVLYYDRYNQNSYPPGIGNKMNDTKIKNYKINVKVPYFGLQINV